MSTRRAWLLVAVSSVAMAGCSFFGTEPASDKESPAGVGDGLEAPALAAQVEAGTLPPLEERLPDEPLVVEPVDEIGTYGGQWRTFALGPDDANAYNPIGYEGLVRWARDYTGATGFDEILPNLAEFEVNDDGSSYTFRLRPGTRWSDGEPFTADDIMFWYEAVISNETLTPSVPDWLMSGGEPVAVVRVDDYTVRFDFAETKAFFLHDMATLDRGTTVVAYPRHYMSQFHPDHNENIDELVASSGQSDWAALFEDRAEWRTNVEVPRLAPWVITAPGNTGTQAVAERNPYYWKVDPDGKQLPYLDEVVYSLVENAEVALLRALDGQVDLEHRGISTAANRPIAAEGQEDGGYWLMDYHFDSMNIALIQLNLSHPDPVKREIFTNKEFRIGLSYAINRQEIIDLVYNGQGEPWQSSPFADTPFYNEQLATQYLDYNVDLANEHLDRAGYSERNGDGIRLGPDGKPIAITLDTRADGSNWTDVGELLTDYWREVGIELRVNPVSNEYIYERRASNQHDALFGGGLGGRAALLVPWNYLPISGEGAQYGVGWVNWRAGLPGGVEPPAGVKEQYALWDELVATIDRDAQEELFRQILDIAAEEFFHIGIATAAPEFAVVSNSMRNLPPGMPSGYPYPNPAPYDPEQFFKVEQ